MRPLDYGRSFLIGNSPANEVRFWVESRTRIVDEETGKSEDYIQAGSCKSEHTFAERDLFHEDNYDFLPIFGPEDGVVFRRKANLNPNYRNCLPVKDLWNGQRYHLIEVEVYDELTTNDAILEATYEFWPIVAQTEIWNDETQLRAIIEYPVKTMNTNRENTVYQVDTGPVAFPDLTRRDRRYVEGITLAFVAFNVSYFADFVLEVPTPIRENDTEVCRIYHYSKRVSLPARNRLYAAKS
jgi:hypothetical protein